MAKGGISKGKRGPSIHSRAARRETSPSINTDKSLKFVTPPQDPADKRPTVLGTHHNGGVTKSSKRKQHLSSKQRQRQEKSMDRAEAIMDRTVKKVEKSKGKAKVIYSRRRTWEEVNGEVTEEISGAKPKKAKFSKEKAAEDEYVKKFFADDDDEEMEEVEDDTTWGPADAEPQAPAPAQIVPAPVAAPPVEEEDEIL